MDKLTRADSIAAAADLVVGELTGIDDRCSDAIDGLHEEMRTDNEDEVGSIDWSSFSEEDVLDHPTVREAVLAHVRALFSHLTYMRD